MGTRISSLPVKISTIADNCCYAAPMSAALFRPLED
jgi:hypothetical protein